MSKTKNIITILGQSVAVLLFLPSLAFAVGFGSINVNSRLGEPLNIEVELLSVTPTEIGTMAVGLGSRTDFARANMVYPEYAGAMKFDIGEGLDGQYYVAISSEVPFNDTFLHMLLSASWSGGKVIREYTALLDPPLYSGESASVVEVPETISQPQQVQSTSISQSSSESSYANDSASSVSVVSGDTLSGIVNRLGIPDSISMYQALTALVEQNPDAFVKGNMNRLKAGVTLSVPKFSSIGQIDQQLALDNFKEQTAEYNQYLTGIGYLPEAVVSDAPTSDETQTAEVDSGSNADSNADSNMESDLAKADPEASSESEILTTTDQLEDSVDLSELSVSKPEEDTSKLIIGQESTDEEIASAIEGNKGDDAQIAALKAQLAELDESLLASGVEDEAVKQRLKEIQIQVDRVSSLIEVEDSNLAASQANASTNGSTTNGIELVNESDSSEPLELTESVFTDEIAATQENEEAVASIESTGQADGGGEAGIIANEDARNQETESGSDLTVQNDIAQSDLVQSQLSQTESAVQTESEPEKKADLVAPVAAAKTGDVTEDTSDQINDDTTRTVASSGIMSNLSSIFGSLSDYVLKIAAGLLVIIAGLFFYRRRKSQQEFEESMLDIESEQLSTTASQDSLRQVSAASGIDLDSHNSGFELTIGGGMSYLSEEGIAGVAEEENEVIQEGAVDPLAEADVYLAYDRDEQAVQVLKEAYSSNPERVELAEKLLEIYHKQDDRIAFDKLATELRSRMGAKHHPVWTKVSSMGREVSPENDLYNESSGLHDVSESSEIELDTGSLGQQSSTQIENEITGIAPPLDPRAFLDIELDELNLEGSQSEDSAIKSLDMDDLEVDFDMDEESPDRGIDAPTLSQIITAAEIKDLEDRVAGNEGSEDEDSELDEKPVADDITLALDVDALDFNFADDNDKEIDLDVSPELSRAKKEIENQKQEMEEVAAQLDKLEPGVAEPIPGEKEPSYLDELSQQSPGKTEPYHESETALELAKAYLELGEKDIAKGFIEEVINEGSDQQRAKAEKLVKELA